VWIHALAGGLWVAAGGCFVIAGMAITAGSAEQQNLLMKAAPKINGLCLAAAIGVVVTGGINLALAGVMRNFQFSTQFGWILGAKVLLFAGMFLMLRRGFRVVVEARLRPESVADATPMMVRVYGASVAMGGVALLLGLWLMGS